MNKYLSILAASLILTACAGTPSKSASSQSAGQSSANAEQSSAMSQAEIDARKLAEQVQALKSQSVYFDLDSSVVKPEYKDVMKKQAEFIKAHGKDTVTLEGNCDERGSGEYNLALGEKRANAVRKELALLGVSSSQVKTVSFGEEKPRQTCHEEKCWHENRRVDFNHRLPQ